MDIANPDTLEAAFAQAKLHERAVSVMHRKSRFTAGGGYRGGPGGGSQLSTNPRGGFGSNPQGAVAAARPRPPEPQHSSSRQLIEQRRAAGLCFKCGDRYYQGHQCKNKSLFSLTAAEEMLEVYDEDCMVESEEEDLKVEEEEGHPGEEEPEEVGLSFNALSGENQQQTIKIQGEAGNKILKILVDTGSTHSFLDFRVAKEVRAKVEAATPLLVTVANGHKILSKLRCPGFAWNMHGQQYKADLRIIRLEGSSMVLGIDWLRAYGKVTFNYNDNTVTLDENGRQLMLKGLTEGSRLKMLTAKEWYADCQDGACCAIARITQISESEERIIPTQIQGILQRYNEVFGEPPGVPPCRRQDHHIPLREGAQAVNLRPYRYSYEQKNEIERQVKEMLESGLIQPSTSPYASAVLLVKKRDKSWRFCVDYRHLNKSTIEDKYPIPLIDDLLDELGGS